MGGAGWSWKLVDRELYEIKQKGRWGFFEEGADFMQRLEHPRRDGYVVSNIYRV